MYRIYIYIYRERERARDNTQRIDREYIEYVENV